MACTSLAEGFSCPINDINAKKINKYWSPEKDHATFSCVPLGGIKYDSIVIRQYIEGSNGEAPYAYFFYVFVKNVGDYVPVSIPDLPLDASASDRFSESLPIEFAEMGEVELTQFFLFPNTEETGASSLIVMRNELIANTPSGKPFTTKLFKLVLGEDAEKMPRFVVKNTRSLDRVCKTADEKLYDAVNNDKYLIAQRAEAKKCRDDIIKFASDTSQ